MAIGMGTIFLVSAVSTWTYATKSWKEQSARGELRYDLQKSLERIKEDVRLSDGGKILFYPSSGSSSYTAISMPREYPNDYGLYDYSSGITWEDTVIYHINNNELHRTVVPYNSSSSARQTQLDSAATSGAVSGGTTTTLFSADEAALTMTPTSPTVDGYAASVARSETLTQ